MHLYTTMLAKTMLTKHLIQWPYKETLNNNNSYYNTKFIGSIKLSVAPKLLVQHVLAICV